MKKTNNKGFSLVELIVVVAIMAVLVTVVAPQYLRYVEKTRLQKDNSAIAEIAEAMKMAAADETVYDYIVGNGGSATISLKDSGNTSPVVLTYAATPSALEKDVALTVPSFTSSSKAYTTATDDITLTITIDGNGKITVGADKIIKAVNTAATTETY